MAYRLLVLQVRCFCCRCGSALEPVGPSLYRVHPPIAPRTTMKRPWACLAALLYTACPAFATGLPQPAESPAGQPASAEATAYIQWLEERSVVHHAPMLGRRYSCKPGQGEHPYGETPPTGAAAGAPGEVPPSRA